MSDILKFIRHPSGSSSDPEGNLLTVGAWSEPGAMQRAEEAGVQMTDDHWDVVLFVRDYYRGRGDKATAREILNALEVEFSGDGGKKWLYRLFPNGPVTQASFIAGIPEPSGARDASFGNLS